MLRTAVVPVKLSQHFLGAAEENDKISVRIAQVPTKILTEHLPYPSLDCYHCDICRWLLLLLGLVISSSVTFFLEECIT
jgi:hypothetical protein